MSIAKPLIETAYSSGIKASFNSDRVCRLKDSTSIPICLKRPKIMLVGKQTIRSRKIRLMLESIYFDEDILFIKNYTTALQKLERFQPENVIVELQQAAKDLTSKDREDSVRLIEQMLASNFQPNILLVGTGVAQLLDFRTAIAN